LRHWKGLTAFLREAGAPLDNNLCNAARGITEIMPIPGLCRTDRIRPVPRCFRMMANAA